MAPTERGVKLGASPAFLMPSLDELGDDVLTIPRDPERLQTVYFDTEDFRLARWGVSLRHREGEGWTIKLPVTDALRDPSIRKEFVFPGDDPLTPPDEAIDLIRAYVRTATLHPVVHLRTIRRMIDLLDLDDRRLGDVVDDDVSVLSGRRIAARYRELGIEITDASSPELLEEVRGRLRAAGAGGPDPTPKYVRAIGSIATQSPEVAIERLSSDATVGATLGRALALSVVRLIRHDVLIRLGGDLEGVHQSRVATRRLRSDLRTFRAALDPEWSASLLEELRWLGGILGVARDADVLMARLQARDDSLPATEAAGLARLLEALGQQRKEAHVALIDALRSDRYVALLDRLVEAARHPSVLPGADVPVMEIGLDLLRGPRVALDRAVQDAGRAPTDAALHTIRLRAKRIRYAAEAVTPILGRPVGRLATTAAELQRVLGEQHDAVVTASWLRRWAAERRSGDATFAAGMLAGIEQAAASDARRRWRKVWRKAAAAEEAL